MVNDRKPSLRGAFFCFLRRWPMTSGLIVISPVFWFGGVANWINPMPEMEGLRRGKFMVLEVGDVRPNLILTREGEVYKAEFPSDLAQKGARQYIVESNHLKKITRCDVEILYDELKGVASSDYRIWGLTCPGVLTFGYARAVEYYSKLQVKFWATVRMVAMFFLICFCWYFESRRKP